MKKHGSSLRNYRHPDKYGKWLGYKVDRVDRTERIALVSLRLRDDHLSPAGRVHGGVISGLFDFASGAAVFSTMEPHDYCSTVELKVNYFRPLDSGDRLACHSRVVFRGKKIRVVHSFLHRVGEADPVAMATATFNVVSGTAPVEGKATRTRSARR